MCAEAGFMLGDRRRVWICRDLDAQIRDGFRVVVPNYGVIPVFRVNILARISAFSS